jgi:hypothetical protein
VTGGGYDARAVDMTAAGKDPSGTVTWSMTARYQKNHERDLSNFDPWDDTFKNYDYKSIMHLPPSPIAQALLCGTPSPYYVCDATGVSLTDAGATLVRKLDADAVRAQGYSFGDRAKNWYVQGTARIANFTLGLQLWRSEEGQATGFPIVGSPSWTPKNLAVYLKYAIPLGPLKLSIFSRFHQSSIERSTSDFTIMHGYNDTFLSMFSLVPPCQSFLDPVPLTCAPATPWVEHIQYGATSSQIRTEATAVWEPNPRLSVVGGAELAKGSIQGAQDQVSSGPGTTYVTFPGEPPIRDHSDYAVYGQGSWRVRPSVKVTLAGRMTYDQINNRPGESGFGALFTPRAAVVYAPPRSHFVVKGIYSEAFKDPPDFQKYARGFTFSNAYVSNGLQPERVRNAEINALWDPTDRTSVEGSAYQAHYTHVVSYGFDRLPDGSLNTSCVIGCEQWQNRDTIHVRGLQMTARHRVGRGDVWLNYTRTESLQVDPNDFFGNPMKDAMGNRLRSLQVSGIAPDRVSLGIDTPIRGHLDGGLRADYVGPRKMGPGTTLPAFILRPAVSVPSDTTLDAVLTYRDLLPNTSLQLTAFNVLNRQYYDPGTEIGSQVRILQAGRTIYLRLIYGLPLRK